MTTEEDFKRMQDECTAAPGHMNGKRLASRPGKNKNMGRPVNKPRKPRAS